jgi:hypothetical protein
MDRLDNDAFRSAVLESDKTLKQVAKEVGCGESALRVCLGMKKDRNKSYQSGITYDKAVRIVRAIDGYPIDFGL